MKVKLAETAGFCAGVKRAMELVLRSAQEQFPGRMFTWGPLIHNPQVVEFLESRKVFVAEKYKDLTDGDTVVTRSHGVPPDIRKTLKSLDVNICDATCPRVGNVHALVRKYVNRGYKIFIFGDSGHAEVEAVLGYTDGNGQVISSKEELEKIEIPEKVCLVAQTTKNTEEFREVAEKLIEFNPDAVIENTICEATSNRQKELLRLSRESDALVIVGGRNSGNTRRLYELAKSTGKPSYWVETADELDEKDFEGVKVVGVTAGASTPHWIIARVVEKLELMGEGFSLRKLPLIKNIAYGFVQSNFYAAGAAGMLSIMAARLMQMKICWLCAVISLLYIFAVYTIRSGFDWQGLVLMDPSKIHFFENARKFILPLAFIALIVANFLAFKLSLYHFLLILGLSLGALTYIYGKRLILRGKETFPSSRDVAESLMWTAIVAGPVVILRNFVDITMIIVILMVFILAIVRSIMNSLKDVDSDRILMRESIVILLGERRSRNLALGFLTVFGILVVTNAFIDNTFFELFLLLPALFMAITVTKISQSIKSSTVLEVMIDVWLYIMGIFALCKIF